jgi:ferredoxin
MEAKQATRYLPRIDESACLAHGDCAVIAPEVFELEDVAVVVGEGSPDLIIEAAQACPAGAISVVDAETGEEVYP